MDTLVRDDEAAGTTAIETIDKESERSMESEKIRWENGIWKSVRRLPLVLVPLPFLFKCNHRHTVSRQLEGTRGVRIGKKAQYFKERRPPCSCVAILLHSNDFLTLHFVTIPLRTNHDIITKNPRQLGAGRNSSRTEKWRKRRWGQGNQTEREQLNW